MIWFWVCNWVFIWVEVVGGDGNGRGCGQWWWVSFLQWVFYGGFLLVGGGLSL